MVLIASVPVIAHLAYYVCYLNVSFSRLITSLGEERAVCYR